MCDLLIPGLIIAGLVGLTATRGNDCAPACAPQPVYAAAAAPCTPTAYAPASVYNYAPASSQAYHSGYSSRAVTAPSYNDGRYVAGSTLTAHRR